MNTYAKTKLFSLGSRVQGVVDALIMSEYIKLGLQKAESRASDEEASLVSEANSASDVARSSNNGDGDDIEKEHLLNDEKPEGCSCKCFFCCFCLCCCTVILGVLVPGYMWRLWYLEGFVLENFENITSDSFGTECTVDKVEASMHMAWIKLFNFTIGNPPNYTGHFVGVEEIKFDVNVPSLIPDNRIRIQDFIFKGIDVHIIIKDALHGESNAGNIYKFLWAQPWHFKHLKIFANRLEMLDFRISIERPAGNDGVAPLTQFNIKRVLVTDIGKDAPDGGVHLSQFLKVWAHAVWQAILHNAPGPLVSTLVECMNVAMGGKFHFKEIFEDVGAQWQDMGKAMEKAFHVKDK